METKAAILQFLKTFNGIVDTMIGLQIDCGTGSKHNKSMIEKAQDRRDDWDQRYIFFGRTDPNVPNPRYQHVATTAQYIRRNSEGGANTLIMDRSIIVTVYSLWEEYFRPAIAVAANVEKTRSNQMSSAICAYLGIALFIG